MSKLDVNKQKKLDALLRNSLELFTTKGINATSIAEIAKRAGVAKGTFYLYFKDKYDIRNVLISRETSKVFFNAAAKLQQKEVFDFEERIVFLADNILEQLKMNPKELTFIAKNLGWGFFKSAVYDNSRPNEVNFKEKFHEYLAESEYEYEDPEIMIYLIIELLGGSCYSSILYDEPVSFDRIKPYLLQNVRDIMKRHRLEKKPPKIAPEF